MIIPSEFLKWCQIFKVSKGGSGTPLPTPVNNTVLTTDGSGSVEWSNTLPPGTQASSPSANADVATKQYVDAAVAAGALVFATSDSGLDDWAYDNGTDGEGATLTAPSAGVFLIDGVEPDVGANVLLISQADATQNGIYTVVTNDALSNGVLIRASNYDTPSQINSVGIIIASQGLTNDGVAYYLTAPVTTIGVDNIVYAEYTPGVSSLTSSDNTVTLSSSTGNIDITLPQSISTSASPTFSALTLSGLTALRVVGTNASKQFVSLGYSSNVTAGNLVQWDSNSNLQANNLTFSYASTATSGATTTLTAASGRDQVFTGSSTQTIVMPVTSTLASNFRYTIINLSTGALTVNASDGSLITTLSAGTNAILVCVSTSITSNAAWIALTNYSSGGSVTSVGLTVPSSSIFGVTNSPITGAGDLGLTTTGNSGGIPYFSAFNKLSSSAALAANSLVIGGGFGGAPSTISTVNSAVVVSSAGGVISFSTTLPSGLTLPSAIFSSPTLGTPLSGNLNNCTGLPIGSGVSGLGTGVAAFLATPSSSNLAAAVTDETGSGALVFAISPTLTTPNIGVPTAGILTNCTGLPIATGVSGLAAGIATFLATPTSANLAAAVTNETGTGALVFATSPSLTTPSLGAATASSVQYTTSGTINFDYTANSGSSFSLNPTNGASQGITLTADCTITLASNPSATTEREIYVSLIQDGTGSRVVTWSNVTWGSGISPTLNSAASTITSFVFVGTTRGWVGYQLPSAVDSTLPIQVGQASIYNSANVTLLTQGIFGICQYVSICNNINTTDATTTTLQTIAVPTAGAYALRGFVKANRTSGSSGSTGDSGTFFIQAGIKNAAGTAAVIGGGITAYTDQTWTVALTVSGSNILVTVTGAANNNISWTLFLETF